MALTGDSSSTNASNSPGQLHGLSEILRQPSPLVPFSFWFQRKKSISPGGPGGSPGEEETSAKESS